MRFKLIEDYEDIVNLFSECIRSYPSLTEDLLLEYSQKLAKQPNLNKKLKSDFSKLANDQNYQLTSPANFTVHHIDQTIDSSKQQYANNAMTNLLFIDTSTLDANICHQLLHYFQNHGKTGLLKFYRTMKELLNTPTYKVDEKSKIIRMPLKKALKISY